MLGRTLRAVVLLAASQGAAVLRPADAQAGPMAAGSAVTGPTVVTCTSLANLRSVLRATNGDAAAAVPIITDPRSDLGCSVLDRGSVTGISEHLALNGKSYDCLSLQGTSICHWVVAGSVPPPVQGATGRTGRPAEKGRP